jgi:hypothetical protein
VARLTEMSGRWAGRAFPRLPWALLLSVCALVAVAEYDAYRMRWNVSDDAMTSMQYAKNLARGNGLVFNVGERVDGYTNFLWVLFMTPLYAFCHALGVSFVPALIHATVLIAAGCVVLVYVIASRHLKRQLAVWIALLFTVVDNAFTTWAGLGLEVHFLALFMLLALYFQGSVLPRRSVYAGLALLAAHLTRPDAALFCAAFLGSEAIEVVLALFGRDRPRALEVARRIGITALCWLLPFAGYFAWHYAYYGFPFPNTYYVKLGGEIDAWARGFVYVRDFFEVRWYLPLLGVFAIVRSRDRTVRTLLLYLPAHTLYVVYVGGDFMPGHRFFVPELPLFGLLLASGADQLFSLDGRELSRRFLLRVGLGRVYVAGFVSAAVIAGFALLAVRQREGGAIETAIRMWRDDHSRQRQLMRFLKERVAPGSTFATCLIGHTGFLGDFRVIDTCAIIDPVIAHREVPNFGRGQPGHEKTAPVDYILAKKPDYIGVYVLSADLWQHGYYLDVDLPPDTVDGVWTRDTRHERGEFGQRFDFETSAGFRATGRAFDAVPSRGSHRGQGAIVGAVGGFVNSFHPTLGNTATGTLTSPSFVLRGDELSFRIAGGADPERLKLALVIDGREVLKATGRNRDAMGRRAWDIRLYRGQRASLTIVDAATEPWGYLAVDEIDEWRAGLESSLPELNGRAAIAR